ncbi:Rossmann-like alpha/beta/alpha sandwich fold [Sesbania bispinosa]|nr:Rossmann-like alpha/beta/alpha sandwich fold [Sesbania bispinosa]
MDIMESHDNYGNSSTGVSEIEEEDCDTHQHHDEPPNPMATICEEDSVYVAVGKSETSMEALLWTLNNLTNHSTILYLIHVFPEIKHIPNPYPLHRLGLPTCEVGAGMIPRDKVSAEQVESYVAEERGKRRDLLQKFLQSCSTSKVKADTILIESDLVAKAIIDLIPILQIRNLVIGANKFYLRKSRSKKGNGIADQVLQNAPENCKVRIICEGKEVNEQMQLLSPPPQLLTPRTSANDTSITRKEDQQNDSVSCICFKSKSK